jgi:hypothetical protein
MAHRRAARFWSGSLPARIGHCRRGLEGRWIVVGRQPVGMAGFFGGDACLVDAALPADAGGAVLGPFLPSGGLPDGIVGLMPRLVSPSHKETRAMTTS